MLSLACLPERLEDLQVNEHHRPAPLRIGRSGLEIVVLIEPPYDVICRSDIQRRIITTKDVGEERHRVGDDSLTITLKIKNMY